MCWRNATGQNIGVKSQIQFQNLKTSNVIKFNAMCGD